MSLSFALLCVCSSVTDPAEPWDSRDRDGDGDGHEDGDRDTDGSFPQLLQLLFFNFPAGLQEERDCGGEVQDFKSFRGYRQETESPGQDRAGDKVPWSCAGLGEMAAFGGKGEKPP